LNEVWKRFGRFGHGSCTKPGKASVFVLRLARGSAGAWRVKWNNLRIRRREIVIFYILRIADIRTGRFGHGSRDKPGKTPVLSLRLARGRAGA